MYEPKHLPQSSDMVWCTIKPTIIFAFNFFYELRKKQENRDAGLLYPNKEFIF